MIDEACQRLGCSRASVYRLVRAGALTKVKVPARPSSHITERSLVAYQRRLAAGKDANSGPANTLTPPAR